MVGHMYFHSLMCEIFFIVKMIPFHVWGQGIYIYCLSFSLFSVCHLILMLISVSKKLLGYTFLSNFIERYLPGKAIQVCFNILPLTFP